MDRSDRETDAPPGKNEPTTTGGDKERTRTLELGVELLANLEEEVLSLPAAVDRVETVTRDPILTREILDEAERRGIIERDDGKVRTRRGGTFVRLDSQVVRRDGEFDCRRCGANLTAGHFVQLEADELGPFGPECVRKVIGRD